jgi:hypothetical protein
MIFKEQRKQKPVLTGVVLFGYFYLLEIRSQVVNCMRPLVGQFKALPMTYRV